MGFFFLLKDVLSGDDELASENESVHSGCVEQVWPHRYLAVHRRSNLQVRTTATHRTVYSVYYYRIMPKSSTVLAQLTAFKVQLYQMTTRRRCYHTVSASLCVLGCSKCHTDLAGSSCVWTTWSSPSVSFTSLPFTNSWDQKSSLSARWWETSPQVHIIPVILSRMFVL